MIEIVVPATSANLGPGFDCLGLALGLANRFRVELAPEYRVDGCPPEWAGDDNLFLRSFRHACERLGAPVPPVALRFMTEIPPARGLGSSASLAVAGAAAALLLTEEARGNDILTATARTPSGTARASGDLHDILHDILHAPHNARFLLRAATDIEGHPDNAAPAIFGGFTAAAISGEDIIVSRSDLPASWQYIACIPDFNLETSLARRALPDSYPRVDVVHALSHAALMALAIEKADAELLRLACEDRVHEPYRGTLIADFDIVTEVCRAHACSAVWISGSGPTILAAFDTAKMTDSGARTDSLTPSTATAQSAPLLADVAESISVAIAARATQSWRILSLSGDNQGIRARHIHPRKECS